MIELKAQGLIDKTGIKVPCCTNIYSRGIGRCCRGKQFKAGSLINAIFRACKVSPHTWWNAAFLVGYDKEKGGMQRSLKILFSPTEYKV